MRRIVRPGHGGLPAHDELPDRPGRGDVEPERRFVEEEDPGVVEEAAGEVHLLALAGREGPDALLALLLEPDRVDELLDPLLPLAHAEAVELAEHPELLADGEHPVARLLPAGDHVHDPAELLGLGGNVEAEDPGGSLRREEQGGQDLDEGRLAGPVRAEQAEELARRDLEVDAVEGDHGVGLRLVDAPDPPRVDGRRRRDGVPCSIRPRGGRRGGHGRASGGSAGDGV